MLRAHLPAGGHSVRHGVVGAGARQHLGAAQGRQQPALVLLHHMDVVPADPKYWSTIRSPRRTCKDGEIFGRGALDTKTLGIVELEAFLALHRAQVPLDRDVIFIATADEEAGGTTARGGW